MATYKDVLRSFRRPSRAGENLLWLAVAGAMAATAWGQASAPGSQDPQANRAAFEVASVRPAKSDCTFTTYGGPPGRYVAICTTLWGLIYNAYDVRSFHDYPPGLPAWADKDRFDVDAKANDDAVAAIKKLTNKEQEQLTRDMLQSLLADRFQLRVHYVSKMQPIYELVLAKGGSKLKPLPASRKPGWSKSVHGEYILGACLLLSSQTDCLTGMWSVAPWSIKPVSSATTTSTSNGRPMISRERPMLDHRSLLRLKSNLD